MKSKRQGKILELIKKYDIETQDELIARLAEAGIGATQATISRDILESITSADYSLNDLVIKTIPSMASAIAAGIDDMDMREVLGCVAGDDCVIVITRTEDDAAFLCRKFRELIKL